MSHAVPLSEARQLFAEELRVVAHIRHEEVVRAFAAALKSLRRDPHLADETCWLHGDGWCVSKRALQ